MLKSKESIDKITFAKLKILPTCTEKWAWYVVLKRDDTILFEKLCERVHQHTLLKFGLDPHLFVNGEPVKPEYSMWHPVALTYKWRSAVYDKLQNNATVYVNVTGGWRLALNSDILEVKTSDDLHFPTPQNKLADVEVSISQYGDGVHYYLKSNKVAIFDGLKFDTLAQAVAEASFYALPENIKFRKNTEILKQAKINFEGD
jgi:hypothetical protein